LAAEELSGDLLAAAAAGGSAKADAEQVTQRREGDVLEARSTSRRIKTVEDLLAHIEADMTRYEVAASEATKWEVGTSDGQGGTTVTELHRVWVRLKPKAGPSVRECVEAMISAASKTLARPKVSPHRRRKDGLWSMVVISDLHVGSKSWRHATGHDYDISIAGRIAAKTTNELIQRSESLGVARRSIVLAGDTLHFDTIAGTTTSGTYLDRDTRIQKAIECAADAIFRAVDQSAENVPTDVVIVPGNHDSAMTWALQKILVERYRQDRRVSVNEEYTSRKYLMHGRNLIGVTHGDKGKKKLAGIMALEAADNWSKCVHREWHVGHLHHQAAEISTIDGVVVRTHPTIVPPDAWHFDSGFIGAERAMQGFVYAPEGGLLELHMAYAGGS
jgi:UDP-2,3-diacylglucosamine pyrophosphatase LpxH